MRRGILIVVSGPSGVGKTTVIKEFMKMFGGQVVYSVSATTRKPRPGEINGIHYIFLSEGEFRERIERGEFLEYAEVHGHLYGTPREFVEKMTSIGKDVIMDIDVQGARQVREKVKDAVFVFLVPPTAGELVKRLKSRGTETSEELLTRISNAIGEISEMDAYDYVVINDAVERAAEALGAIYRAEKQRTERMMDIKETLIRGLREYVVGKG